MKVKLYVKERLFLLQLLPPQGTIETIRLVRELREGLSFTEQEFVDIDWVEVKDSDGKDTGHRSWNADKDMGKEIEVGKKMTELITTLLTDFSKSERVTEDLISVYDKFPTEDNADK